MNTIVVGVSTVSLLSCIGNDLISRTIKRTSDSICSVCRYLTNYDEPYAYDVVNKLKKIDLEFTVSVLQKFVEENKDKEYSDSIKESLLKINEILQIICGQLNDVKESIEDHQAKYLYKWRSLDCKANISSIEKNKKILDNRYQILMDLLKVRN